MKGTGCEEANEALKEPQRRKSDVPTPRGLPTTGSGLLGSWVDVGGLLLPPPTPTLPLPLEGEPKRGGGKFAVLLRKSRKGAWPEFCSEGECDIPCLGGGRDGKDAPSSHQGK